MEENLVEKEFLSILMEQVDYFNLIQIKPKYLQNKNYQKLFEALIACKNEYGTVDFAIVVAYDKSLAQAYIEAIDTDYTPLMQSEKLPRFMTCQKIILEKYKTKVINDLSEKLKAGKITNDNYLKKMDKINEVNIREETTILTEQEIRKNIDTKNNGIRLISFPKLNDVLKMVQSDFLIIGAPTGNGKSGLLLNLMNDLMERYQCIYFNMEMSKATIYKRMVAIRTSVPISDIEEPKSEYQLELINNSIQEIVSNKIIIEHKANSIGEIKTVLNTQKDTSKHTILFLDHVGLVRSDIKRSIYEQTTEVAKKLRQFCLDYDCTIISACQLSRASYGAETLGISMLKDSGELENSASKVVLLYKDKEKISKDKYKDNMILDVVKNRDGMTGQIACTYDKSKQIFREEIYH